MKESILTFRQFSLGIASFVRSDVEGPVFRGWRERDLEGKWSESQRDEHVYIVTNGIIRKRTLCIHNHL
jgi:hypothetical protein